MPPAEAASRLTTTATSYGMQQLPYMEEKWLVIPIPSAGCAGARA